MAKIECWYKQDRKKPVKVQTMNGAVFTLDNVGSLIGVEIYENGVPVDLTGSVNGYIILPDDTTVSVAGTRSGNKASINLPQSALTIPGIIKIAIKLTNSNEITTVLAVVATVARSRTDTIITPSQQIITDWSQQIAAEMQAVEDASAAQDAKISDLKSALCVSDNIYSDYIARILNESAVASVSFEKGNISSSGNNSAGSNNIRTVNYIPVVPGIRIKFTKDSSVSGTVYMYKHTYDKDKNHISEGAASANSLTIDSTEFGYIRVMCYSPTVSQDTMLSSISFEVTPSEDFTDILTLIHNIDPLWNVEAGGIYIDGDNIIVNNNGFGVYYKNHNYYIAPIDRTSSTTFSATGVTNPAFLVIDIRNLVNAGARNEPSNVMSVITYSSMTKYHIPVAQYYKTYWDFVGPFRYFIDKGQSVQSLIDKSIKFKMERVDPCWNISVGGIYFDGRDVVVAENGFAIWARGKKYYVAPLDQVSVTRFTAPTTYNDYDLIIDVTQLTNPDGRNEPSSVLSIISPNESRMSNANYVHVARWYKTYWDFVSPFDYFKATNTGHTVIVSPVLSENNLIAHVGGTSQYAGNTYENLKAGIANGYKISECDVCVTSDAVPVVSHNTSFTVDGVEYVIKNNTYEDLVAVKPDLATLESFLLYCKTKNVVLEIDMKHQDPTACNAMYGVVKKIGMRGKAFFTCTAGTARTLLSIDTDIMVCVSGISSASTVDEIKDISKKALLCICSTPAENISDSIINAVHDIGALSKIWTVNTVSTIESFFESGGDLVITDSVLPADNS